MSDEWPIARHSLDVSHWYGPVRRPFCRANLRGKTPLGASHGTVGSSCGPDAAQR
jgi:hypothetical protein